jgi:16S rRNA processing protein RimM
LTPAGPARPDGTLEVGRIGRPHGVRGEVLVRLTTDRSERLAPGSVLHGDAGELVVARARPHQDRWIVAFRDHDTRDAAEALRGQVLRAEPLDDPDELWVHELVGARVETTAGEAVGSCVAVVANPAADLLELDTGALVPVVFVVDHGPGRVTIDPPDGLFDV